MQEAMDWTVDSGVHVCVRGCACWRYCWSRADFLSLSVPSFFFFLGQPLYHFLSSEKTGTVDLWQHRIHTEAVETPQE